MKNPLKICLDLGLLTMSPSSCRQLILSPHGRPQKVVVEFSSINIAKPMHMGHFRATIVGNFVKNINLAAGNNVISINYLGDWGTQFGLISLGFKRFGNSQLLEKDPLKHLYSVYRKTCESLETSDAEKLQASSLSTSMEKTRDPKSLELWALFRNASLKELSKVYARMNINFDRYEYESQYVEGVPDLVKSLLSSHLAKQESDGSVTAVSHEAGKRVTLLKQDGGSLYLSRDLVAAISRFENLKFDRIHYVVEDGQREHFLNLQNLIYRLGFNWAKPHSSPWPLHVPFARVVGASTRRGSGVFLSDILDEAQREAYRRLVRSPYTKTRFMGPEEGAGSSGDHVPLFEDALPEARDISDKMGLTWLVAEMLKLPRLKPVNMYINLTGRPMKSDSYSNGFQRDLSGFGLQYCHARLCSLEKKAALNGLHIGPVDDSGDFRAFIDSISSVSLSRSSRMLEDELLGHLALLPNVLTHAYLTYEAHGVFLYCSRLVDFINRAWRFLPVLTEESKNVALLKSSITFTFQFQMKLKSRLAIFRMARMSLGTCLSILGVEPLTEI